MESHHHHGAFFTYIGGYTDDCPACGNYPDYEYAVTPACTLDHSDHAFDDHQFVNLSDYRSEYDQKE